MKLGDGNGSENNCPADLGFDVEVMGALHLQRNELRKSRMELLAAQDEARLAREEARQFRAELRSSRAELTKVSS